MLLIQGDMALLSAVKSQKVKVAEALVQHGADVSVQDMHVSSSTLSHSLQEPSHLWSTI